MGEAGKWKVINVTYTGCKVEKGAPVQKQWTENILDGNDLNLLEKYVANKDLISVQNQYNLMWVLPKYRPQIIGL